MKIDLSASKPGPRRRVEDDKREPSIVDQFDDPRISTADRILIAKQQAAVAGGMSASRGPVASPTPAPKQSSVQSTTSLTGVDDIAARVTNNALGPEWVRQDFPSRHIAYDGQDIFVRPLNIPDLSRLSAASRAGNFTMYADALSKCISIDIRSLTPSDLTFLLYWLRMNTFPTAPMTVKWTSKYGNACEYRVQKSDLEIIELTLSRAEYEKWLARGICLPTVRDMELVSGEGIPDEDKWQVELAQYVHTDETDPKKYLPSKLARLAEMGAQGYLDIQEFAKLIEHGVVERVTVRDTNFNVENAIAYLTKTADELEQSARQLVINGLDNGQEVPLLALAQHAEKMREEAAAMSAKVANNEKVAPEQEVIALSINAMTFFPSI